MKVKELLENQDLGSFEEYRDALYATLKGRQPHYEQVDRVKEAYELGYSFDDAYMYMTYGDRPDTEEAGDDFDYTDYSMRQGEMGNPDRQI